MLIIMQQDTKESIRNPPEIGERGEENIIHLNQRAPLTVNWIVLTLIRSLKLRVPRLISVHPVMTGVRKGGDHQGVINTDVESITDGVIRSAESMISVQDASQEGHLKVLVILIVTAKLILALEMRSMLWNMLRNTKKICRKLMM